ncbi:MAG: DUF2149 domain-containing protein [Coriobacteriia bacterium]|nr:DUF2149 domain-containing protein [Coriobacteriia bacterium]
MSRRDFTGSGFSGSSYISEEDADPRVGLVNLADVMLVFAAGLMCALVVHWNVNLPGMQEVTDYQEMTELDSAQIEQLASDMQNGTGGTSYVERGVVYEDPTTGKIYMLTQDAAAIGADETLADGSVNTSSESGSN